MIEKLIASFLSRPGFASIARDEFVRLQEGGHLSAKELETLASELQAKLAGQAEAAQSSLQPLVLGIGKTLRESLDIPSRQEILELTAALKAQQQALGGASAPDSGPATTADSPE